MSLFGQVLTQVQAQLKTVLLPLGVRNVYRRKQPRLAVDEDLPACVVHPGEEEEYEQHSENVIQYIYPVYVTLFQAANGSLEEHLDLMLDWREAVRKQFYKLQPLSGLSSRIIDGEVVYRDVFHPGAFQIAGIDIAQLETRFLSQEYRDDSTDTGSGLP